MISKLEMKIAKCPELSPSVLATRFPESNRTISSIAEKNTSTPGSFKPYCSVKTNKEMEKYLEIIFYNELVFPETKYSRFVIVKNYKMTEEEESKFFHLLFDYHLDIDMDDFYYLQDKVREFCPESHIITYDDIWYFRQFIEQVYFSTHRSGVREVLYKCPGIEDITYHLNEFDCYNIIGSTAEEILGVPLKLLRLLNNTKYQFYLYNETTRKKLLKKYAELSSFINWKVPLSEYQLRYLLQYEYFGNQTNGRFNKKIFDCLSAVTNENARAYDRYFDYIKLYETYGNKELFEDVPKADKIEAEYFYLRKYRKYCFEKRSGIIQLLEKSPAHQYEYSDNEFVVIVPGDPTDFFYEAKLQQNCVVSYIELMLLKKTNVLFLRRKSNINRPFVTLEIRDGRIKQAKARFNEDPSDEVIAFLEKYAKQMNIEFKKDDVILPPLVFDY